MIRLGQLASYGWIGAATAVVHYGVLIALVELSGVAAVPATLAGFVAGAGVSYALNRRFTFATERSHGAAGWRFLVIAAGGFVATWALMTLFVDWLGLPYLPMQLVTTGLVMGLSFTGHKFWSFADRKPER
jgi:putative flippase GtrA